MIRGEVSIRGILLNNSKTLPDAIIRGYVSGIEGVKTLKTDANGQFTRIYFFFFLNVFLI